MLDKIPNDVSPVPKKWSCSFCGGLKYRTVGTIGWKKIVECKSCKQKVYLFSRPPKIVEIPPGWKLIK